MNAQEMLATTWGFRKDMMGESYRAPLQPIDGFPLLDRGHVDGERVMHPPYVVATREGDVVDVMVCDGVGWRARIRTGYVFADSDNVPEAWKEAVADSLAKINERWPNCTIFLRDRADTNVGHRPERSGG